MDFSRTSEVQNNLSQSETMPKLVARAVALLARREHSAAELARKLRRSLAPGDDPAWVEQAIERVQSTGLLSDERFAAALVRSRAAQWGNARLQHELAQRGVNAALGKAHIKELEFTELERARALWHRRFGLAAVSLKERQRQARFLLYRGFSMDIVRKVLGELTVPPMGDMSAD
jgi:regulatory protein